MAKKQPKTPKRKSWGPNVEAAMVDAAVEVDARGLMALAEARAIVRAATAFEKGAGRDVGETHVLAADTLWAALLSLDDAAEFCAEATRLVWKFHPRGRDNVAPVERYGDGVLPWIAGCVQGHTLRNLPWCLGPCLQALETPAALALLWDLGAYVETPSLVAWELDPNAREETDEDALHHAATAQRSLWIGGHGEVAWPWLVERAEAGDEGAQDRLRARALRGGRTAFDELVEMVGEERVEQLYTAHGLARELTAEAVLSVLDEGSGSAWPEFNYAADGRLEYFALRLIALRQAKGDGWAVVFERLGGSYPDALRIDRFAYGSELAPDTQPDGIGVGLELEIDEPEGRSVFHGGTLTGPAGAMTLDESVLDTLDLRLARCCEPGYYPTRVALIRAYLARFPGAWWPDPADAIAALELDRSWKVLLVSDAFAHASGEYQREGVPTGPWQILPSASPTFRSLAEAIAAREPARFEPCESNLDWRRFAFVDEPCGAPWTVWRRELGTGPGAHLAMAMADAGVQPDARGLMDLAEARAIVAAASRFDKGQGRALGGVWVQDSDRLFAALLSLEDGDELARAMQRITFAIPPRGGEANVALAERYGAGALAWLRARVEHQVLANQPSCLRACVLALEHAEVVDLLVGLDGFDGGGEGGHEAQRDALLGAWLAAHGATGWPRLAELADRSPLARRLVRRRALLALEDLRAQLVARVGADRAEQVIAALELPPAPSREHVLAVLDQAASSGAADAAAWPRFLLGKAPGVSEYHGMRLFAARDRASDRWGILVERRSGASHKARVWSYLYGPHLATWGRVETADREIALEVDDDTVTGPDGVVALGEPPPETEVQLTESPEYWTRIDRVPAWNHALRTYLAEFPRGYLAPTGQALELLGLPPDAVVVADELRWQHATGPDFLEEAGKKGWNCMPSETEAYGSLGEAIAAADPSRFAPGEPNVDWTTQILFAVQEAPDEEADDDDSDEAEDDA